MTIKSFKDAAYQAAVAVDSISESASYVVSQCPTFLEDQPKEVLEQLNEGWMLRYNEKHPAKLYMAVDKNLVQVDKPSAKQATKEIGIYAAMSYSQQHYGQLKNTDPLLHKVIGEWRVAWKKYRHNRLVDLISKIRELQSPEGSPRKPVDAFTMWVEKTMFPNMVKRNKTSKARGDDTAMPDDVLKRKIAAFQAAK
jgi:hypothetical protein